MNQKRINQLHLFIFTPLLLISICFNIQYVAAQNTAQSKQTFSMVSTEKAETSIILNDTIKLGKPIGKPYTVQLKQLKQYKQSVQIIVQVTNNTEEIVNHFWLHISLIDQQKGFLYREQPTLFTEILPHKSQSIEILCESVSVDEVGFIVLHPQLLEVNRKEQLFDIRNVELIQAGTNEAKMIFKTQVE